MTEQVAEQQEEQEEEEGYITVRSMTDDRPPLVHSEVRFQKNFGSTLEESALLYGEEVVHSYFVSAATIRCQGRVRAILDKGGTKEAAIEAGLNYKPGVITRVRVARDPVAELARAVIDGKLTMQQLEEQLHQRLTELKGAA